MRIIGEGWLAALINIVPAPDRAEVAQFPVDKGFLSLTAAMHICQIRIAAGGLTEAYGRHMSAPILEPLVAEACCWWLLLPLWRYAFAQVRPQKSCTTKNKRPIGLSLRESTDHCLVLRRRAWLDNSKDICLSKKVATEGEEAISCLAEPRLLGLLGPLGLIRLLRQLSRCLHVRTGAILRRLAICAHPDWRRAARKSAGTSGGHDGTGMRGAGRCPTPCSAFYDD